MARDNMTRNIRNDLRRFAGTMPRYAKGTAQLFFASGKEYFHTQMPAIGAMLETNQDVIADSIRVLRNPAEAINRQVDRALNSESYKALQSFAKNALDDLKTGNLYDPDRDRSSIGMEIDSMLSDFGGFDMTGFNEEGDWDGEDLDDTDHEVDVKIAEVQEENASRRTAATIDAIEASTKAMTSTANANGQVSLRMSMKQHAQQMNAMQNLITTQGATFELINKGLTAQLDVAREAHNQVMTEMGQMKTLLTEIRDALHPPQDQKPAKPQDDVFGTYGELNIKNYIKQVAKNFDEKFDIRNNISMATGGLDLKTMLDMVSDNPLQLVTDMLIQKIIPESTKTRMANTNKNMESFFPALLNKFANRGKAYAEGDSTKFGDMLMGLFGIETRSRTTIDTNYENPLAAAQFTSKTVRAIEEVIPMWLARIDSHLTGAPLMVYNYQSGKLERARDIISSNEHDARDLVGRMGDTGRMMLDRADAYKFTDPEMKKAFNQYMYRFLQDNAEKQTFINPNLSKDEFMRLMPEPEKGSKEMFYNLIRGITNTAGKDELMQMSRDMMSARQQRHTANEERNKRLQETGQIAAWSFMDSDDVDFISSQTRRGRLAMNAVEIDEALRERKKSSRINTPGATNELLDGILGTLKKGIITYSYNIGTMSPDGDVAKIFDIVTGNAISQREVEATIEQRIRDDNTRRAEMIRLERERLVQEQRNIITDGNDYARQRFVDVNTDESTATDIQGLIQVYRNPKAGSTNNASTERYRQWFGGQVDNLRGNMDEIMSKTGAERALAILRTATETPFQLFEQGLQLTDAFMFKALFGGEIADYVEDRGESSLVNVVTRTMEVHMKDAKDFLRDQIGDPMKKYLLDPDEGLLPRIGKRFNELIEPLKAKILGDRGEDGKRHGGKLREIRDKFTGVKNQETGLYEGGKFSDQVNRLVSAFGDEKQDMVTRMSGAIDRLLYGDYADSKRKGTKFIQNRDEHGRFTKGGHTEYQGVIGNLRKGFDSFKEMMFGDEDSQNKWKLVKDQLNEAFPDMTIGAGIGALAGLFLPGGPIVGAALGMGGGLLKGSSELNKYLFGEETEQEEVVTDFAGNPVVDHKTGQFKMHKVKKGGLIDQKVQEGFKQYVPAMAKGAGIGAIASIFLPGGPVLGGVIGSVMGMTGASERVKAMLFGGKISKDGEVIEEKGLFPKEAREKVLQFAKDKIPGTIAGGLLGSLLGAGVGMIPGLAIAGPVFTIMGSLAGFANSEKWKEMLLGKEIEEDEYVDGKPTGKKIKKHEGGLFGKIFTGVQTKIIDPLATKFNETGNKIGDWFHKSIVDPLHQSMEPLRQRMAEAGENIKNSLQSIGDKISEGFARAINIAVGNVDENGNVPKEGLKEVFKRNVTDRLASVANKIFDTLGTIIGKIISAPFRALAAIMNAGTDKDDLDAEKTDKPGLLDRLLGSTKEERWQKRAEKRHAKAQRRADKNFKRAQQHGKSFWSRLFGSDKEQEESADTQAAPTAPAENPADAAVTLMNNPADFYKGLGYDMSNEHHKKAVDSWVQATGGKGGVDDYKSWVASNRVARKKAKGSTYSPAAQSIKDAAGSGSAERAETPRETSQRQAEEKTSKDHGRDEESNRKKNTRESKGKSNTDYLKDIAKYSKKIYEEVKSTGNQTNGVGWNTAYIKTLLEKQYGELSSDELPEEMEGSKKSVKKRRGILGKIKDKASSMFGGVFDWLKDKTGKVTGAVGKVIEVVTHPFKIIGKAAEAAGGALKKLGGGILDFLKFMGDTLGTVVKGAAKGIADVFAGAGSLIKHAAGGIGEALGNVAGMLTGALKDVVLSLTAGARGLFEIAADIAPDIAHTIWSGLKTVAGGIGKGVWKGVKAIGGGVKKGIGWLFNKITGGDKDKDGEPKEKIKTKNIGKFVLDGGYLDTLKDPVTIRIGETPKTVPFPWVSVYRGKAIGNSSKRAIPVYIMGIESTSIMNVINRDSEEEAPSKPETPAVEGSVPEQVIENAAPTPNAEANSATVKTANEKATLAGKAKSAKDKLLRQFKRIYKKVDTAAENGTSAGEVYDSAVANATDMSEIQAAETAAILNPNGGAILGGGDGEKKEDSGLLSSLFGGASSLIETLTGKKGILSLLGGTAAGKAVKGALSKVGASGAVQVLKSGLSFGSVGSGIGTLAALARGDKEEAIEQGAMSAGRFISNIVKKDVGGIASKFIGNFAAGANLVGESIANGGGLLSSVAEVASTGNGLIGKILTKISGIVSKLCSYVAKKFPKFAGAMGKVSSTFTSKLGTVLSGVSAEALTGFLKKLGIIITVATTIYDFGSGMAEGARILKVDGSNLTTGMRVAAGFSKALSNLAFGLIPTSWLAETLYKLFASDEDDAKLDQAQADFKQAASQAGMDLDSYNEQQNKTMIGQIGDGLKGIGASIASGAQKAWEGIKGGASAVWGGIKSGAAKIGELGGQAWDSVKKFAADLPGNVYKTVTEKIPMAVGTIVGKTQNFFENVGTAIGDTFNKAKTWVTGLPDKIAEIGSNVVNTFNTVKENVANFVTSLPERASNALQSIGANIVNGLSNVKDKVVDAVSGIPEKISETFTNIKDSVTETVTNAWESAKAIPGKVKDTAEKAVEKVKTTAGKVKDKVVETASNAWDGITSFGANLLNGAKNLGSTIAGNYTAGYNAARSGKGPGLWGTGPLDVAMSSVASTATSVKERVQKTAEMFGQVGQGIGSAMMNIISKALKGGEKALPSLFSLIGSGMGNMFSEKSDEVTGQKGSIVSTLATGVSSGIQQLAQGDITGAASTAVNTVKSVGSSLWTGVKNVAGNAWSGVKNFFGWGSGAGAWGTGVKAMNQTASKYNKASSNMALAGCGPTAAAMVASAYGKSSDPREANALSYKLGMRASDGGTNPDFYSKYAASKGFSMHDGPVNGANISSALSKQQPVVLMGKGGAFGSNMHYMVADGLTGKGGMTLVDPLTGARRTSSVSGMLANTANAIYSSGKGPGLWGRGPEDGETGSTMTTAEAQQALVNKMASIEGRLNYSLDWDKQNPDIGAASCASTVGWAYNKVLGVSGMSANALKSSEDSRFTTIFTKTDPNKVVDVSQLQPGDVMYQLWPEKQQAGKKGVYDPDHMSHAEMYSGDGYDWSHGGGENGTEKGPTKKTLNDYRLGATMMVRRYTPFLNGQNVTVNSVDGGSSAYTGSSSGNSNDSSTADYSSMPSGLALLAGVTDYISNAGSKFDSFMSGLSTWLGGGTHDEISQAMANSGVTATSTSSGGNRGRTYDFSGSPVPTSISGNSEGEQIYNWLISKGYTPYGASGLMGCWQNESGNKAHRVEGDYLGAFKNKFSYEKVFGDQSAMDDYVYNYLFPAYANTRTAKHPNGISINKDAYKYDGHYYPGIGLAQWTGGRSYALKQYADQKGVNWGDTTTQLGYFQYESENGYKGIKDMLNSATSPEDGARIALDHFEMGSPRSSAYHWSSGSTGQEQLAVRAKSARQIYDAYGAGPGLWGRGADTTNLNAMNSQIRSMNEAILKQKSMGESESTVTEVTNAINDAMQGWGRGPEDTTESSVVNVIAASLAKMVELLDTIAKNTEPREEPESTNENPRPRTAQANNYGTSAASLDTDDAMDVGAKIMNVLTSK